MKTTMIAAVVAAAGFASGAMAADTVSMKYTGKGSGSDVKATYFSNTMNVFAGQLKHMITSGTGWSSRLDGEHRTFCTDFGEYVTTSYKTYRVVDPQWTPNSAPMGVDKANAIRDIYTTAGITISQTGLNNDLATAFQLAVWDIVADYSASTGVAGLGLSGGHFKATKTNGSALSSGITGHYNTLINSIGHTARTAPVLGLTNNGSQDQLVYVPTPGSLSLAGLGGLLAARRQRRSK